jgi:hypothetical protein
MATDNSIAQASAVFQEEVSKLKFLRKEKNDLQDRIDVLNTQIDAQQTLVDSARLELKSRINE